MTTNKKIRDIAMYITMASLFLLRILEAIELRNLNYDIVLAIFGGSALSCITAQISYNSEVTRIKRTIIFNIFQIQAEIKKILATYNKTLDYWDENDFHQVYAVLIRLLNEFTLYSNTIMFETGKTLDGFIKVKKYLEIYQLYIGLVGNIRTIGVYLEKQNKESAFETYNECIDLNKEIVKKINTLLKKEYGKYFVDINSGLL